MVSIYASTKILEGPCVVVWRWQFGVDQEYSPYKGFMPVVTVLLISLNLYQIGPGVCTNHWIVITDFLSLPLSLF